MNDGKSDHARHVIAVVVEFGEGLDAAGFEVARNAGDHGEEVLVGNIVTLDRVDEGGPERMAGELTIQGGVQIVAPTRDR